MSYTMDLLHIVIYDLYSYFANWFVNSHHVSQPGGGCQLLWHRLGTKVAGRSGKDENALAEDVLGMDQNLNWWKIVANGVQSKICVWLTSYYHSPPARWGSLDSRFYNILYRFYQRYILPSFSFSFSSSSSTSSSRQQWALPDLNGERQIALRDLNTCRRECQNRRQNTPDRMPE